MCICFMCFTILIVGLWIWLSRFPLSDNFRHFSWFRIRIRLALFRCCSEIPGVRVPLRVVRPEVTVNVDSPGEGGGR